MNQVLPIYVIFHIIEAICVSVPRLAARTFTPSAPQDMIPAVASLKHHGATRADYTGSTRGTGWASCALLKAVKAGEQTMGGQKRAAKSPASPRSSSTGTPLPAHTPKLEQLGRGSVGSRGPDPVWLSHVRGRGSDG